MMKAAQLTGPKCMRLAEVADPPPPGPGEVLVEVLAVGICGSDLHMYETGTIGGLDIERPLILGHEFSARILDTGGETINENGHPLRPGMRIAVEPHVACGHCRPCLEGNPNLCPNHYFYGVFPTDGALCERMLVQARNCFPIPDSISDSGGALLETLGVALHTLNLGKVRVGDSVAVIGCGPVGVLTARLAVLAGASPVLAFDLFDWRVQLAREWGIEAFKVDKNAATGIVAEQTAGDGVDVAIEAAWADHSVQQAIEMARHGGRVVMAGIPPDDQFHMQHSTARRKGLTLRMARRMKFTYPRAIQLTTGNHPLVNIDALASHHYSLAETPKAYGDNAAYKTGLLKAVVRI